MRYLLAAMLIVIARGAISSGQELAGETSAKEVEFPTMWVNSEPITAEVAARQGGVSLFLRRELP